MTTGRFAPSPTGELHLGNLRTALVAWWWARRDRGRFLVRMEDLDRVTSSPDHERAQLEDLASLGMDWDGPVIRQSDRFGLHRAAIAALGDAGLTYECWCTRREILEAVSAPHGAFRRYPGTCRELTPTQQLQRRAAGRPAALRLRRRVDALRFVDAIAGPVEGEVDDVVLCRNDGVPAYNLAVVVDDSHQEVDLVVRGDDLLAATASQLHIADLLGLPRPLHAHVPLVQNASGDRLAKRDGAVTLSDLAACGHRVGDVVSFLARTLGQIGDAESVDCASEVVDRFDPTRIPRSPLCLGRAPLTETSCP